MLLCFFVCHKGKQRAPRKKFHQATQKILPTQLSGFRQQTAKISADESKTECKDL